MDGEKKRLAKSIALACVRNTFLEELHSGLVPQSEAGDYTDVKLSTPSREIPWNQLSRISDDEIRQLMREVVDKIYTVLMKMENPGFLEALNNWGDRHTSAWDEPELRPNFIIREK